MEGISKKTVNILSRKVLCKTHAEESPYFVGWKAYEQNRYHPQTNPNGIIQMGLAENQLSFDLIEKHVIEKFPESHFCGDGLHNEWLQAVALHQDYHGLQNFREVLAGFMERVRGKGRVAFDQKRMVLCAGATAAVELISFCLADPGEAFLIPTPYYPGFDRDIRWRTGVELVQVPCYSSNGFQLTLYSLNHAYTEATKQGIKIKGLILINPSNPLGTVTSKATLESLLTFTAEHHIHLICDEVFSGTVFAAPDYVSVAEILNLEHTRQKYRKELVHLIYSLSKDLGIPGFRVGVLYSFNDTVVECARMMSSFCLVSSQTQHLIAWLLSDARFVDEYIEENRRRVRARRGMFEKGLEEVDVKCLKGNAGLFCWVDLREFVSGGSKEEEIELWKKLLGIGGLNVSPGSSFHCSEMGWFRMCFANLSMSEMEVALKRFQGFVERLRHKRET